MLHKIKSFLKLYKPSGTFGYVVQNKEDFQSTAARLVKEGARWRGTHKDVYDPMFSYILDHEVYPMVIWVNYKDSEQRSGKLVLSLDNYSPDLAKLKEDNVTITHVGTVQ